MNPMKTLVNLTVRGSTLKELHDGAARELANLLRDSGNTRYMMVMHVTPDVITNLGDIQLWRGDADIQVLANGEDDGVGDD